MPTIRRLLLLLLLGGAPGLAAATSQVVDGQARFQFLTPTLLRLEYAPSGHVADAPSAVVQKRDWPDVPLRTRRQDGWLIVQSGAITLRYKSGAGAFTAANLDVRWRDANGEHVWHPGDADPGNLGGLTYSLDHVGAVNLPRDGMDLASPVNDVIPGIDVKLQPALPGLLSRSGYALIDDSATPLWDAATQWIAPRPRPPEQDEYLFVYGSDYRQALRDYAALCGAVPMVPRYVFGPWITDFNVEYFPDSLRARQPAFLAYDQRHLKDEIERLRAERIPFDTLVLDFAWHNYGWDGGYDFSPLIAQPGSFIDWLRARGIKLSLNDHPGYANTVESILSYHDSHAPRVLADLGRAMPPKAGFDLDIAQGWRFAADPRDEGLAQHWFARDHGDRDWAPIQAGLPWGAQGHAQGGIGWYATDVRLPATLPPALYLYLGEVKKEYRLFVNGRDVPHTHVPWPQRLTVADIAPYVQPGRDNRIVLRVMAGHGDGDPIAGGLLLGPVALRDVPPPPPITFNLADQHQAEVFMRDLHAPLMRQGVANWWVDGGGGAASMPGLNPQLWTNKIFYEASEQATSERGFILSRYGDWGSERYPAFFTGDTYSEWPVLAYEVAFTARGGNVLVPYISHDIGGFHGALIPFDLYARWIEFGAFSPVLRMHSAHANPQEGNVRMPWNYGDAGVALMRKYFTLRKQLVPYLYSYAWQAHAQALPLLRPLYLADPVVAESYRHPHEYFLGEDMLVAPVVDPSGDVAIYLPPGQWFDFFSGQPHPAGNFTAHYAVDATPVFVRDGAIVPEQPASDYSDQHPLDRLIVQVYGGGRGHFALYEDDGRSLDYDRAHALTALDYAPDTAGWHRLRIGATQGRYASQPVTRAYAVRFHLQAHPQAVALDGHALVAGQWQWDAAAGVASVDVPARPIGQIMEVSWR